MSTKLIESVVNIVKPDTIIAWQRRLDKNKWDYSDSRDLRIHNPCLQPWRNLCFSCPTPHIRLRRFTQPLPCLSRLPSGPIFANCKMPEFFEMSPLSWAEKYPILRWRHVSVLSPQMSSLMSDGRTKHQILAQKSIFFEIFPFFSD